ncbi:MAG: hypothetical protein ACRCR9_04860 [Chitinophagaceae bacterium]
MVVNEGVAINGKTMNEHLEAINYAQAIAFIRDVANATLEIKELHAIILHGINKQEAGKYRSVPVMIVGSRYIPPPSYVIPSLIEKFIV